MSIPSFFGDDKTRGVYEALAIKNLTLDQVRRETPLFQTKWFDYRGWHFMRATYYLAHCYREAVTQFLDMTRGDNRGETGDPFGMRDVLHSREFGALLRMRQTLDQHGIRYDWAMRQIVHRFSDRGWRLMPRPNQLYGEEVMYDLVDAWTAECKATLQLPTDARYRVAPQGPEPRPGALQPMYARWAVDQVKARSAPAMHWMPLSTLLRQQLLTLSQALAHFEVAQVERAASQAGVCMR